MPTFTTRPYTAACLAGTCHLLLQIVGGGSLGIFSVFFFPLILAIYTVLTLAAAALVGLLLYLPRLRSFWQRDPKAAATVLVVGVALFVFGLWSAGDFPPLEPPDADPDTQDPAKLGVTTYPGLLIAVFAVLHWPARADRNPPQPNEVAPADHREPGTLPLLSTFHAGLPLADELGALDPMNPPFEVSPEAERYLVERLTQSPRSENEPSLTHALRSSVCDHGHYFLGASPPSRHAGYSRVEFGGIAVAISPTTLESLRGLRLSVQRIARIDDPSRTCEILVATDPNEVAPKA